MADWREHCPLDDDHPARRRAWRDGWNHGMDHGPGAPDNSSPPQREDLFGRPALLSIWLRGYSAADQRLRSQEGTAQS